MPFTRILAFAAAAALVADSALAQAPAGGAPPAGAPAAPAAPAAPPSAAALAFKPLPTAPAGDLAATLQASGQFTKLLAAVDKTNLTALLKGARPLTIFAPTDEAFNALPAGQLDQMMAAMPATQLQGVLVYHIVGARVRLDQVKDKKGPIPSAATGKTLEVDGSMTPMKVNDAVILQADVPATNGSIYVIDKVLTPTP